MVFVTSKAKTDPEPITVVHQGYHIVLPESACFDVIPMAVHQPDGFPVDRAVRVDRIQLNMGYQGRAYITASGQRRLLDGGLSAQHFAGCSIRWSQIPTEVRKQINAAAGPEVRKWWRS